QRIEKEPRESLSLGGNPILIETRQELALVEIDGVRQVLGALDGAACLRRCLERLLELCHIRGDGGGVQAHTETVGADDGSLRHSRRLELVAEAREGDRETVPESRRIALRPEHLDEDLARVRLAQVER